MNARVHGVVREEGGKVIAKMTGVEPRDDLAERRQRKAW